MAVNARRVAVLLAGFPELVGRIERLVVMGGALGTGNTSGVAEFNIHSDPEAAHRVLTQTDVPVTLYQYVRQRLRWERDAIWIRFRKHARLMNPLSPAFRLTEAIHEWDFALFNVAAAFVFPVYLVWLFVQYGSFALAILVGMQIGLMIIDTLILAASTWCTTEAGTGCTVGSLFGVMRGSAGW